LTPDQLQEARRRSGRLGGRPTKPTQAEARAAALEELVPPAIRSLRNHLGDGDPAAWRAGLRVLELAYGPVPPEQEDVQLPDNAVDIRALSWRELQIVAAKLLTEIPMADGDGDPVTNPVPILGNGHDR
jgi:hypothetical protein